MVSFPSTKYKTPDEERMLIIALETENFSIFCSTLDFFLNPAVSEISIFSDLNIKFFETVSLVVPDIFETIDLSSLTIELKRVDFPALGLP